MGLAVAGGVWLRSDWEDRERIAGVEQQASVLIDQAERLMVENAASTDYDNASSFNQASELMEQVKLLGNLEEADEPFRNRRDRLLASVKSETQDRKLVTGIGEALMIAMGTGRTDPFQNKSKEEAEAVFARAFGDYGINPSQALVSETVAWLKLRRDTVRERILAGLLQWEDLLKVTSSEDANRLKSAVATADPDPWRQRFRGTIEEKNLALIKEMVESDELTAQPVMTLLSIGHDLFAMETSPDHHEGETTSPSPTGAPCELLDELCSRQLSIRWPVSCGWESGARRPRVE